VLPKDLVADFEDKISPLQAQLEAKALAEMTASKPPRFSGGAE
jgi:hypothetical protein